MKLVESRITLSSESLEKEFWAITGRLQLDERQGPWRTTATPTPFEDLVMMHDPPLTAT